MSEKLHYTTGSERAIGDHELLPPTDQDRLLQVLTDMEQPLHVRDIHLLAEGDGYGEININKAMTICSRLFLSGKLVKISYGIYSLPEFADKDYDLSEGVILEEGIKGVLEQAGRPLLLRDLITVFTPETGDDAPPVSKRRIEKSLYAMLDRGEVVRPGKGVYSLPQFEDKPLKASSGITINSRLYAVIGQASQPVSLQEIRSELATDSYDKLDYGSVASSLQRMCGTGKIVRTSIGCYSLPEFAESIYSRSELNIGERCLAVFWQTGRALYYTDLYPLVEADGYGSFKEASISSALHVLVRENLIVRIDRGIYALPEFSCASDKRYEAYVDKTEITAKVVKVLDMLGGSSSIYLMHTMLAVGNLEILSQEQVAGLLKRMAEDSKDARKIVRTGENTYCLPELADKEYEEIKPLLKPRLSAVLKQAAKPLHWLNICDLAERAGYGSVRMRSALAALDLLVHYGDVVKIMRGVYALPEFANEGYELPKLSTSLRIELSLLDAARPLSVAEIHRLVNIDDQEDASLNTVGGELPAMTIRKQIVRLTRGVYALPEFADREYESPENDFRDRLVQVFSQSARPLYLREIVQRLQESDDGQGRNYESAVERRVRRMVDRGEIVKVSRGVYALPEFAEEKHELLKPTIRERLTVVLGQAARPLHLQEAADRAELDGFGVIKRSSVMSALDRMEREGLAIRVSRGIYCLSESLSN